MTDRVALAGVVIDDGTAGSDWITEHLQGKHSEVYT
jgi:hypothetical protein